MTIFFFFVTLASEYKVLSYLLKLLFGSTPHPSQPLPELLREVEE